MKCAVCSTETLNGKIVNDVFVCDTCLPKFLAAVDEECEKENEKWLICLECKGSGASGSTVNGYRCSRCGATGKVERPPDYVSPVIEYACVILLVFGLIASYFSTLGAIGPIAIIISFIGQVLLWIRKWLRKLTLFG